MPAHDIRAVAEMPPLVPGAQPKTLSATSATWASALRSDLSLARARIPWIVTTKNRASALAFSFAGNSPFFCARLSADSKALENVVERLDSLVGARTS